jgi:hypothetical protein
VRLPLFAMLVVAVVVLLAGPASALQPLKAVLNGAQVVPPTGSPAMGLGCFTLNADNTLDYLVSYSGLLAAETGAHIHGPAPAGVNAGVQFALPLGTPKMGILGPLTAQQASDLSSGLYYVQIHTTMFPGGEIRGQILVDETSCVLATEETTWGGVKALYE